MGFSLRKPDDTVGSAGPAIMIGLFVAFGGVLFGYVFSVTLLVRPCSLDSLDMTRA